ncbi:ProQ/FINO family protein [Escherichia coli]|uniref:ProQ/FINO family protein n=1 Tax=Escherichia coli TaxID=562 RepID=UPI000B7EB6C1|nr:ProQ/FINO family protein [Escherichia coli]MED9818413.1 proQ/FINO family protein [Escherichia coli]HBV1362190.1 proQ/FINO family protein [Escherichia coli]HCQ0274223.1 proQ/FINO family protein [Escherichia coli]
MARNQENKTPVIVVKKRRVISPTPVVDNTALVTSSVLEVTSTPAADDAGRNAVTSIPDGHQAPAASGKKKKGRPPRRPIRAHWTREFTDQCMKKVKLLFPHLRAEDGGFLSLKVGISRDIPAWLAEHPEAGLTRYDLDGKPAGQVSEDEAQNARRWLAIRERRWQERQATLTTEGRAEPVAE